MKIKKRKIDKNRNQKSKTKIMMLMNEINFIENYDEY